MSTDAVVPASSPPSPSPAPGLPSEQFARVAPGVDLCFQTFGERSGRPLLLIMGLGGPMTWWPVGLCQRLADRGFFVIRYDNRDTGRSTRFTRHPVRYREVVKAFLGRRVTAPYSLSDMAADGIGLLDHLGLVSAHVTGVSIGVIIAQTMAV